MKTIRIEIPEMQSSHCELRVKTAIQKASGSRIIEVSSGSAKIEVDSPEIQQDVINAIQSAGYKTGDVIELEGHSKDEAVYKFKTDIKCSGCVSQINESLDNAEGICHWDVETASPDHILTVHSIGISEDEIKTLIRKKGFNIQTV